MSRALVFAEEGTIADFPDGDYSLILIKKKATWPLFVGDLLFAHEGALVDASEIPSGIDLVTLTAGAAFPLVVRP